MPASDTLVLVTGGSGFVGSYCILHLLRDGYRVRTTVRNLNRADEVRKMLKIGGATEEQVSGVEFCAAELAKDDGWKEACGGCTYVLHVASPFPPAAPKHEDELIVPAREGTLRALRAAKAAETVKRVVITSSFAAIGYGHPHQTKAFNEEDWTVIDHPATPVPAYQKSKTIAERAAWDWIAKEGGDMELAVVNPVGIFGPILSKNFATSILIVEKLMNGALPGLPALSFGAVDVRDVADLHVRAMTAPEANGQRFLAVTDGSISLKDIAEILKRRLGTKARKVPMRGLPTWLLRIVAYFDSAVAMILPELGKEKNCTNEKASRLLGWQPMSVDDSIVATAESLERFGLLK